MRLSNVRTLAALLALLALAQLGSDAAASAPRRVLPNPVLVLTGTELYQAGGKNFIRYSYLVYNSSEYPDSMFTAAPGLPTSYLCCGYPVTPDDRSRTRRRTPPIPPAERPR